ncbi:uncharacterized protein G2W53_037297 [Senna tora]|uniref:Uncharacterized protein n=1 Tax=Senna tora TaxID=362788 RepID=A0A834T672_9FABA|nr:uncharacterized protein G2W53_037297 [Senna tora]
MPPRRRTLRSVASDENRRPPRRSALEATVVGLQGVVEALTGLIAEQRAEDPPQVTPEIRDPKKDFFKLNIDGFAANKNLGADGLIRNDEARHSKPF